MCKVTYANQNIELYINSNYLLAIAVDTFYKSDQ